MDPFIVSTFPGQLLQQKKQDKFSFLKFIENITCSRYEFQEKTEMYAIDDNGTKKLSTKVDRRAGHDHVSVVSNLERCNGNYEEYLILFDEIHIYIKLISLK